MKPAADALQSLAEEVKVKAPSIPVLHNIDVKTRAEAKDIKEALAAQASAVLWAETVREIWRKWELLWFMSAVPALL